MWKSAEKGLTNNICIISLLLQLRGFIQSRDEIPEEQDPEDTKATQIVDLCEERH